MRIVGDAKRRKDQKGSGFTDSLLNQVIERMFSLTIDLQRIRITFN